MDRSLEWTLLADARAKGIERFAVGAVITRNSKVLLLRRKKDDFMGGIYEFPGGQVEPEESLEEALIREVEEETGMRASEPGEFLGSFDYTSANGEDTRVFNFAVAVKNSESIVLREHDDYMWADRSAMRRLKPTEDVARVLDKIWRPGRATGLDE